MKLPWKILGVVAAAAVLVVGFQVVLSSLRNPSTQDEASLVTGNDPPEQQPPLQPISAALGPASPDLEVSPKEIEWDAMSDSARMTRLRATFSEVLGAIQAGDSSPILVAQAEDALSNMRTQMYTTPAGRQTHQELEQQLVDATER